jgi:hypothetical protein
MDRPRGYSRFMPLDLGHLIGQPSFEVARGIVMQAYGYTSADALTAITEVAHRTGTTPSDLVAELCEHHQPRQVIQVMSRP